MCFDCGCRQWDKCHSDLRHVTTLNITGAFNANDGQLTPEEIVQHIKKGLDVWLSDQMTKKSMSADGHHFHITIEPYE